MKLKFMNVMKFSLAGEKKKSHCIFTEKKWLCYKVRISYLYLGIQMAKLFISGPSVATEGNKVYL